MFCIADQTDAVQKDPYFATLCSPACRTLIGCGCVMSAKSLPLDRLTFASFLNSTSLGYVVVA